MVQPDIEGIQTNLLAGVFDGHGGEWVSHYLAEHFSQILVDNFRVTPNIPEAFRKSIPHFATILGFIQIDNDVIKLAKENLSLDQAGSTATLCYLLNDQLHLAYVGDSAAILIRQGGAKT